MAEVTALMPTRTGKKVRVYLNGAMAFALDSEVVVVQGIHVGDILSEAKVNSLRQADLFQNCMAAALRFLHYRPRSEREIRQRLRSRRYKPALVEQVVSKLRQQGYIDDPAFARYWVENRVAFSPRSRRMIRQELMHKGVESEIIESAVEDVDDFANARRAGLKKGARLASKDYDRFKQGMYDYLKAQGFNHDTIMQAIECLWEERDDVPSE